jgi:O-antigen/teichoic acid export membrane protein
MHLEIGLYWLVLLVSGSLLFNTLNQTYIPSLNMLGFAGWFIVLTLATQVVGLSLAVFLTIHVAPRAEYWLLGMLLSQTLIAITAMIIFERKTQSQVAGGKSNDRLTSMYIGTLFKFAWPLSIAVGLGWLQSQGYRFVMERTSGLAELGLFVAGYSISAGIIAAFESVLTTYFQPQFYKRINTNDLAERAAAWNAYASALFPALLVTVFFIGGLSDELSRILFGPAFQSASTFVLWGALAEAARVLAGAYSLVAHAQMKTRLLLLPNATGALLAVGLAAVLIPSLGGAGAGLALVTSSVALVAVMYWEMRKQMAIKLPIKRLAIGALVGGVLLVTTHNVEQMLAYGEGILATLSILGVVSVIYLAAQYWLIVPMLRVASEQP